MSEDYKSTEQDLHRELLSLYRRTGEATGYWPSYFHRSVRADGGLAVAKKLLDPRWVSSGFERLTQARRADLSVEAIALQTRFRHLFTSQELQTAQARIDELSKSAWPMPQSKIDEPLDDLPGGATYGEGAVRKITVNSYERNPKAREACVREHGTECHACGFNFERAYGGIGSGYIHIHHKRQLSTLKSKYKVDPKTDLVPVCANCHAMIHRRDPAFDVEQIREFVRENRRNE